LPTLVLKRRQRPSIKEDMKNNDSHLNQAFSWKEFEVITRNCPHAVRFENRVVRNKSEEIAAQVRYSSGANVLDTEQILFSLYKEDEMTHMEEFRVKRNNERFGFSVDNPSDEVYHEHASHK
jgi:hypothetical protein